MITLKNVSKDECIKCLKDHIDNEKRNLTIFVTGEWSTTTFDYTPTGMKNEFKMVESKLTLDLHGIIEEIQMKLERFWWWVFKKPKEETIIKMYILMEYLQMKRYNNPGIDFDNQTIIIFHLEDPQTKDIHCQIVGSTSLQPNNPDFIETIKELVNTFLKSH